MVQLRGDGTNGRLYACVRQARIIVRNAPQNMFDSSKNSTPQTPPINRVTLLFSRSSSARSIPLQIAKEPSLQQTAKGSSRRAFRRTHVPQKAVSCTAASSCGVVGCLRVIYTRRYGIERQVLTFADMPRSKYCETAEPAEVIELSYTSTPHT